MNLIGERIKALIRRYGESYTYGFSTEYAITVPPRGTQTFTYLTPSQVDAAVRPVLLAYSKHDSLILEGATITLDGRDYVVKKVVSLKARDEVALKILVLA